MLMCFAINQRHQQIQQNRQLIRYIIVKKKILCKAAGGSCWVKEVQTSAWWDKFLTKKIPEYEWRDNFRITQIRFYELCDMLRPWLQKKKAQLRREISVGAQVGAYLYYISNED